jgi:hypothetical protein
LRWIKSEKEIDLAGRDGGTLALQYKQRPQAAPPFGTYACNRLFSYRFRLTAERFQPS